MATLIHNLRHPFGEATVAAVTYAATIALEVNNAMQINTVALTGDATINVTAAADLPAGSRLVLQLSSDGTARDVTCGTNLTGPVVAGVINKTKVAEFVYNGSAFIMVGTPVQID